MISTSHATLTNDSLAVSTPAARSSYRGLRVCMLAYAFYESDTRILQYATALAERGDTVDVIALQRDGLLPEHEVLNGVNVYRIQARTVNEKGLFTYVSRILRFFLRSALFLHRSHRQQPYDIVHVHNVPDFLVFAAVSPKWGGVPIILDIHDLLPEFYASKFKISYDSFLFRLLTLTERCSVAFSNHVIIANDLWRDRLVARSSRKEKCSVVRNRPDLGIFIEQSRPAKKNNDKFLLTYPGSLNWHQGLDIAIRAFASIANSMPDAEFHIYGEGPAKPSLMMLANELEMQNRVIFHDFLPSREIARVMAATDLAVEPKRATSAFGNEALSTKILEFMSLGVPVIACRTKIHAFYYDDSIVQYYENDDEMELAKQILWLRTNPDRCNQLIANAKEYARRNTWDARKGEYLDLVDSLIRRECSSDIASSNIAITKHESPLASSALNVSENRPNSLRSVDKECSPRYVLLTSAHNEELLIEQTIGSVISQTTVPVRWVIVSDGSTDRTDEIVQSYCRRYPFIRYFRLDQNMSRGVVSKIRSLTFAYKNLQDVDYDFLGNLDADVSFSDAYFQGLLAQFRLDSNLGIGGGLIYEKAGGEFRSRLSNSITSVAHAAQLVRRECYEEIGGYVALKYGGEDWHAEINARMLGWRVQAFPDLRVMHHRQTGGADWVLRHRFREGKMDYSVGSYLIFELLKCIRRVPERPIALGASVRFAGFCWSYTGDEGRLVSPDFVNFLRREQRQKIAAIMRYSKNGSDKGILSS
jgi:glycosyltransferase involved in cell wall biosynthesis